MCACACCVCGAGVFVVLNARVCLLRVVCTAALILFYGAAVGVGVDACCWIKVIFVCVCFVAL